MQETGILRRDVLYHDTSSPICIFRVKNQTAIQSHRHDFIEIVLILSGRGIHVTGQVRHVIKRGDVLVIRGGRSHAYEETHGLSLINVLFTEEILDEAAKGLGAMAGFHPLFTFEFARWEQRDYRGRLCLNEADMSLAVSWVNAIDDELRPGGSGAYSLAQCWLMLLIGFLARKYGGASVESDSLDKRLGLVLARIDRAPGADYPLPRMAEDVGVSERSLLRYFHKATGGSPLAYVIRKRIQFAQTLLLEEPLESMTNIAFRSGFNDSNYFSRQFKQLVGISPREYRQRKFERNSVQGA